MSKSLTVWVAVFFALVVVNLVHWSGGVPDLKRVSFLGGFGRFVAPKRFHVFVFSGGAIFIRIHNFMHGAGGANLGLRIIRTLKSFFNRSIDDIGEVFFTHGFSKLGAKC